MSVAGRDIALVKEGIGARPMIGRTGQWVFVLMVMATITVTEWIFAYHDVAYGIGLALFVAIGIYAVASMSRWGQPIIDAAEALALIPLYILFTSSLPWFFINQQYLLPGVYATILALCAWHIYQKKINLVDMGFKKKKLLRYILIGIALGIPLGTVEYLVLQPAPASPTFEIGYLLRDAVYMILFVGLAEEVLFRGLLQTSLTRAIGWKWSIVLTSVMFAVMHLTWRSIPELGFVFIASMVLGYIYYRTKSLVAPIALHGVNNIILVAVMPYLLG
ncbi:lysostaphin resistance A-like protein [Chloroflexota bacterium]